MVQNEERKRKWQIFYSPLAFIILLIVFFFMLRSVWRVYGHMQVSSVDRAQAENELADARSRSYILKNQVAVLETPQGIDEEIRSKFNVSKAGEGVAMVVGNPQTTISTTTLPQKKSWWQSFLSIFMRD